MSIIKYLRDKISFIIFYVINMIVLNLVLILDENMYINYNNVLYIDVLSMFIISLYLINEYRKYKKIYQNINTKINNNHYEEFKMTTTNLNMEKEYYELFNEFYRSINDSKQKLQYDNEQFYDFITTWVHAVKIPIAASRLIIENDQYKDQDTFIQIEDEIDKIERYVEQTLYYSRSMSFSKDYIIEEFNLDKLVKQSIKKFAKTFIAKKVSLSISIDDKINIHTDKKWFLFILEQVLSNSLKYSSNDKHAEIDISSYEDNTEYRLIIKDNGVGIKKEDLSRVFERGFTGFNGRFFDKSTGMGLYLANKLGKKLGHKISIESKVEEYTQVTIRICKISEYYIK